MLAVLDPSLSGEVGGLGTVEAVVEAGVIGVREGYHELTSLLCDLTVNKKAFNHSGFGVQISKQGKIRSLVTAPTRHQLCGCDYSERSDVLRSYLIEGNAVLLQDRG